MVVLSCLECCSFRAVDFLTNSITASAKGTCLQSNDRSSFARSPPPNRNISRQYNRIVSRHFRAESGPSSTKSPSRAISVSPQSFLGIGLTKLPSSFGRIRTSDDVCHVLSDFASTLYDDATSVRLPLTGIRGRFRVGMSATRRRRGR